MRDYFQRLRREALLTSDGQNALLSENGGMDLLRLRSETALDHDQVEASLPVMDPELTLHQYVAILQHLYGFVLGWEGWAESAASDSVRRLLSKRKRSELLATDLEYFEISPGNDRYSGPQLSTACDAEVLGAMYVMEGSTLGGQYIARHLEQLFAFDPGHGNSFFSAYRDQTGRMWMEIKNTLGELPASDTETVIRSAKVMFSDFAKWNQALPLGTRRGEHG